jgi:hypothetical protein
VRVTSPRGHRTSRRARCRKHAYAANTSDPSSSAAFFTRTAFVTPAHASPTALNNYDNASRPSVTGDDPVNASDPTGLISAGTICGEYGSQSSQCAGAQSVSEQVGQEVAANQIGSNKPIIDIAGNVGSFVEHNFGTIAQVAAGGACIVVSAGACIAFVVAATAAKLTQLGVNGKLTASSAVGTVALGGAEVATAGVGGIFEYLGQGAGEEFANSLTYLFSTKGLAALSAIPFWFGDFSDLNLGNVNCPG